MNSTVKKTLAWTGVVFAVLLVAIIGTVAWVLNTQSGTRFVAARAQAALGDKLAIGSIEGSIAGPLRISDLHYRDPAVGIDARVAQLELDLVLGDLWHSLVHVGNLALSGVDVLTHEPTEPKPEEPSEPFTLQPPINIAVDKFLAQNVKVRNPEATVVEISRAEFAGQWTDEALAIQTLDVQSPQGFVKFSGRVVQDNSYVGEGRGQFRWTAGEQTVAGTLIVSGNDADALIASDLSSPLKAQLNAKVAQAGDHRWQLQLDVPRFDPREELMPDSSFESLAASLRGEGTLDAGVISGKVTINDEPLQLDSVRFTRSEEQLTLESLLHIGQTAGELIAKADIQFSEESWTSKVSARWRDVVVPPAWAGQELYTRGELTFDGNPQLYNANGRIALGPKQQQADIALNVRGTPELVELQQFDIVQKKGRLAATGKVILKPELAWVVDARGQDFDPGAFAVEWPGSLRFQLATQGKMTEQGPDATLKLTELRGRLRGRPISGDADMSFTPPYLPAGTLALNSGQSKLRVQAAKSEQIDATIAVDVASLNDWLPNSGGELSADFRVLGKWPDVAINGDARGRELHLEEMRLAELSLDANVNKPLEPDGSVKLSMSGLSAAGFEFDTLQANASGNAASHRAEVSTTGKPVAFSIDLQGGQQDDGWSGAVQKLVLDVEKAARLSLREPANIVVKSKAVDVSRACFVDRDIELCMQGGMKPDGSMQGSYSLANVPLALANSFSSDELPLQFKGLIEGKGDVRKDANGNLFGTASIRSEAGSMSRVIAVAEGDEPAVEETLLTYRNFVVDATLDGPDARASISAGLQENGSLQGEGEVRGLNQASTQINARMNASLPDLAPFAVFAPQLANVHGRLDASGSVTGTLQEPAITGEVTAAELAADIPAVGLHLKNGRLDVRPKSADEFQITGGIESGGGNLKFAGTASPSGAVNMQINGERFLAADIPGAKVIITPALNMLRNEERMTLTGKVTIPEADVNLQKLPRGGDKAQAASPDVVIVDAENQEELAEKSIPLYATITVALGENVNLTGFGLIAKVGGQLDVRERPGADTVGSGDVNVTGTYKAYGQNLTIQQGQLLYASTPLDNPQLRIEATRALEDVVAGLRIRGSAQSPELTVFSDPEMGQSDALSYIVAGKPLSEIGSGEGEGDAVQAATRSLGAAAGGLLAKNVGRRLGADELSVKDDEMLGGAALTVGQYLSPRVYLSYGVGLFEPGEVITLRYKLSKDLSVQAQRGPEDTRAGIEYRAQK
ncbi:translocation/assembly module TamB domain-containing protein [Steroidobacter sp.]|uniref:translocation/assembly module TamB domain-containing protein n=1 Tax=Steroidobacter sp. TaxID=1978227 RepID=UPI001A558DE5|nr:translocation/assembly module TamB domain-containing protein [Steroidobacter sp.]MBL8266767.1 translocation/assembly module TamB domain-containing protein [Steroidobacter sp.]